ncbi:MAG: hypothetical protein UR28_C0014G0033 [Candidatus Peregrinibacteria bacterium GW2011_GWF2_33_10]|nr:MAG: hypothetical protein UR28_C0014G0033 [Candidatus Peregrinibacteria bacterium GW2011_GWF2_33_10]OGJ45995.1 MAG: hypothetical protein A2263_02765 [Candidatus Peregrinibacteria bacterium RIFOXYA2_FULL_33_21]OGJ46322.1 MAG: hypothetical protein A2272_03515 [Candidatus Peregrinibacteria bacterium RIFOXYA12_FULL_33_12]OGJ51671.1 MAG: hypothetical protein A2307_04590 [Candidatus Peregrinibacteria bacterium RIFOXYB2_FULL_33_20]
MQILRQKESLNFGDKKNALLKEINESIKLETGHEAEIVLIAKGDKIHPSLIVGAEKIFDLLLQGFIETEEADFYTRFEEALKKVNNGFALLAEDLQKEILDAMSISVGIFVENKLYLTQYGLDIEVYLVRSKHVSVISTGLDEKGKDNELFVNIASGALENNDIVLWSTERLLRYITKTDLGKMFGADDLSVSLTQIQQTLSIELPTNVCLSGSKMTIINENEPLPAIGVQTDKQVLKFDKIENLKNLLDVLYKKSKNLHAQLKEKKLKDAFQNLHYHQYKIPLVLGGVILLLVLVLFVVQSQIKNQQELKGMEATLDEVQTDIDTAQSRGTYDKETAGNILNKAEEKARAVFNSGYLRTKSSQILSEIQQERDNLDNIQHVKDVQLLVDLTTKRDDVNALGIVKGPDNNIYAYEYNALYVITGDRISDVLKIDDKEQVITATYNDDNDEILFLTSNYKIISYKNKNFQLSDTTDEAFKTGMKISAYGGKLYLLAPLDNQIYRYPSNRDGFSKAESYNVNGNLKDAVDFTIDGFIYVLYKDAVIQMLSHGEIQNFSVQKAPIQTIVSADKIYTELEYPKLLVLDSSANKIVVYNKDERTNNLVYDRQLVFDGLDKIQDFLIDKNAKVLYLLTKQKVYRMTLE